MEEEERNNLIDALVGTEHLRLYLNSATFHAKIEMVANAWPIIVDALAVSAKEEDKEIKARIRLLEKTPGPGPWLLSVEDAQEWLGLPFSTTMDG